ncbi:5670_t:CDS:1 [Ambispora leptoticha]|uniref:5670_t:CDS:1 n=1 Tax=Ambispora leptoticha TaxID=144679 RepID=A0A9N9EMH9_9GLOM|nr:5670_t:CDS:1 [Ambispora leptoticha]
MNNMNVIARTIAANNATRTVIARTNATNNTTRTVIVRTPESSVNSFSFLPAHYAVSATDSLLERALTSNGNNSNVQTQNETLIFTEGAVFKEPDHGVHCIFHHVSTVPDITNNI